MPVEVLYDEATMAELGDTGLAAVTSQLWPLDCQTCGRPIRGINPALCVDDLGSWAAATLHHPGCRSPRWNNDSAIRMPSGANTSWTSLWFMMSLLRGNRPDPRPAMLINPGLEMIFLYPSQGSWRPGYVRHFTELGMKPPGRGLRVDRPLRAISGWLANDLISVTVTMTESIYEANAPREVIARARELNGVMLLVTHSLDPADLYQAPQAAAQRLQQLFASGQVICGWVPVQQS